MLQLAIMSKQSEDYKAFEKPNLAFEGKPQCSVHHTCVQYLTAYQGLGHRLFGFGAAAAAFVPTAAAAQLPEVDSSQPTTQVRHCQRTLPPAPAPRPPKT